MLTYSQWLNGTLRTSSQRSAEAARKAADAWQRINEKPLSVTFRTAAGATVAAQTVRVESDNSATPGESAAGSAPKRKVIVFGVRDHADVADTDIKEGYRFVWAGDEYRCVDVILQTGEIQGVFEAVG